MFKLFLKNFLYYTVLINTMFVMPMQLFGESTPLSDAMIGLSVSQAPEDAQQDVAKTLKRAFKFKDIANKAHRNASNTINPCNTINNGMLYSQLVDVQSILPLLAQNTSMMLSSAVLEDMLSHPIDQNTVEQITPTLHLLSTLQTLKDEDKEFMKALINMAAEIEGLIIPYNIDLLQKWVDDQQKEQPFFQLFKKHLGQTLSFRGAATQTAAYITMAYLWPFPLASTPAYFLGSLCMNFLNSNRITGSVTLPLTYSIATAPFGGYLLPAGTLFMGNGILQTFRAAANAAMERISPYMNPLQPYDKIAELQSIAQTIKGLLETYNQPAFTTIINALKSITEINVTEKQRDPYYSALIVIQTLHAIAQLDASLSIDDLVKSGNFAVVKEFSTNNAAPAYKTYLEQMYVTTSQIPPIPVEDEDAVVEAEDNEEATDADENNADENDNEDEDEQIDETLNMPQPLPLNVKVDSIVSPEGRQFDVISIKFSKVKTQETMMQKQMQHMIVKQIFTMHHLAQTLGIIPIHFKDMHVFPFNFSKIALETKRYAFNGLVNEELAAITLPIS